MMLLERKKGDTGSKQLGKHLYPRASFSYLNYGTDSHPDVLILGDWKNPATKNKLVAGINLNYLSSGQLVKLRKIAGRLFRRKSLRARYRFLRDKLPDVAMYYRTYDTNYIKSIERSELDSFAAKVKPSSKDEKAKTTADVDKAAHIQEPPGDVDQQTAQLGKDAWRLKRRLYDPEKQRRRTSPERMGVAGSKAAERAKNARYRRDRKKLKELERQVALKKELEKFKEPSEEPEDIEPDDYGPEYHLDDLGYESRSYINNHSPDKFKLLTETRQTNLLAIFDIVSRRFIVDSVTSHAEMLFDADWDYNHTVLFEVVGKELLVKFDCSEDDARGAIASFKEHQAGRLLLEASSSKVVKDILGSLGG